MWKCDKCEKVEMILGSFPPLSGFSTSELPDFQLSGLTAGQDHFYCTRRLCIGFQLL